MSDGQKPEEGGLEAEIEKLNNDLAASDKGFEEAKTETEAEVISETVVEADLNGDGVVDSD